MERGRRERGRERGREREKKMKEETVRLQNIPRKTG